MLRECSARLRLGAVSLVLFAALGVAQILPALHFAVVVHRVCAEHGELAHASAPVARQAAPAEASFVARDELSHEHEHCGVLAAGGPLAALVPAAAQATAPGAAGFVVSVGRDRAAHVRIALLAYAPKLAPPGALG
jgi:hypothetical protein